ncbi:hypothetical protein MLD38_019093 [Melastoma candidum]|uniref:Uncharacterized protein n=1 Tax=Melastoma candidum TaxID=119954 RepID=A0ACB9QVU5_9MYRT|nr:hypothetical protein MLD38_019093 [Melastoma candidum]
MSNCVNLMKDVLSKKRKLGEFETVEQTEEYIAIIRRKLPPQLKAKGSFTGPWTIGYNFSSKTLCDLGASINLKSLCI